MIAELSTRVWENPHFHEAVQFVEVAWLKRELGVTAGEGVPLEKAEKIIRAAAILACSDQQSHREFQGNIFLIDYVRWKTKPLEGPKYAVITPAIEATLRDSQAQLISVMRNQGQPGRDDDPALETAFGRLYGPPSSQ